MNWKALLSSLVLAMLVAPHAAAARTVTATYEVAFQNLAGGLADPAGITEDGTIDYGGVSLAAMRGETSVTLTIADAAGGAPYFVICQDADADSICGEPGELRATGCGSGTFALSGTAGSLRVFISVQNLIAPSIGQQSVTPLPCGEAPPALGTTGTVTAVFN